MSAPLAAEAAAGGAPALAVDGTIAALDQRAARALFERGRAAEPEVIAAVARIVADVRQRGDDALRELALRYDGVTLASLEVPRATWDAALAALEPDVVAALRTAAAAIATFHEAQRQPAVEIETFPGVRVGRRTEALAAVGVYAPGGRAAYPSSVLMGVIPARVAGVDEVIVCSPPGDDGAPPAAVLAACALAGADRCFAIGGAGAVAALAFGTASVPRVDKVVGPGNAFVAEAKRQVNGVVAIDSPAGPSEILVLADDGADPRLAAAELLAQAEHDPDAAAVLVATRSSVIDAVRTELAAQLVALPRGDVIRASLAARGALLLAADIDEAITFANRYAPEHLLLMVAEPRALLPRVRAAGTVFLGAPSSVAFGDYMTGANHVLPTNGLARSYAGLSTADFQRSFTYQELTAHGAAAISEATRTLATAEGLPAHARAAALRAAPATAGLPPSAHASVPLRSAYAALPLYDPGRSPIAIDLSDNTNLWGPCPAANTALGNTDAARITRYPSVYADELKRAIARHHGVAPENVVTGCGSDDVIDSAVRAFAEPGAALAYPDPTFGMVAAFARMNALRPLPVPLGEDFVLDVDALTSRSAALTYLCNPNNPSGTVFPRAMLARLAAEARGVVLIDEAYADFAGDDFVADAVASERVLVLRTFSKACGLAGLRVGYALGPERLVREVEKSRGPYKVSAVAEAAACAVLSDGFAWVRERRDAAVAAREHLQQRLGTLGFRTWPSGANFVLAGVPFGRADAWNAALRAHGVAVRPFAALPRGGECLRITVGPEPMLERFITALEAVRAAMEGNS